MKCCVSNNSARLFVCWIFQLFLHTLAIDVANWHTRNKTSFKHDASGSHALSFGKVHLNASLLSVRTMSILEVAKHGRFVAQNSSLASIKSFSMLKIEPDSLLWAINAEVSLMDRSTLLVNSYGQLRMSPESVLRIYQDSVFQIGSTVVLEPSSYVIINDHSTLLQRASPELLSGIRIYQHGGISINAYSKLDSKGSICICNGSSLELGHERFLPMKSSSLQTISFNQLILLPGSRLQLASGVRLILFTQKFIVAPGARAFIPDFSLKPLMPQYDICILTGHEQYPGSHHGSSMGGSQKPDHQKTVSKADVDSLQNDDSKSGSHKTSENVEYEDSFDYDYQDDYPSYSEEVQIPPKVKSNTEIKSTADNNHHSLNKKGLKVDSENFDMSSIWLCGFDGPQFRSRVSKHLDQIYPSSEPDSAANIRLVELAMNSGGDGEQQSEFFKAFDNDYVTIREDMLQADQPVGSFPESLSASDLKIVPTSAKILNDGIFVNHGSTIYSQRNLIALALILIKFTTFD